MKKQMLLILIIVGMLFVSGSGCSGVYQFLTPGVGTIPVPITPIVVLTYALYTCDLEEPTEYTGGARYVNPDGTDYIVDPIKVEEL